MSQKKPFKVSDLDFNNVGGWPQNAKIVFCVLVGLFILVMAWLLLIRGKNEQLQNLEREEAGLRADFEDKQGRAANLEPLKQQLAQMEQVLQQMLRQLPSKTEMPDLIIDISQTALSSGLSNELFQPGPEMPKEFYAEKPIALRMVGSYHQFGAFVSGVASLPRVVILTMHDISLKPKDGRGSISSRGTLELSGTVKTYRYLDEEETARQEEAAAKAEAAGGGGVNMSAHHGDPVALRRVLLMGLAALALAACGRTVTSTPGQAPNLVKWAADVRARPAPPLEPLPVMQQFETFEYAAQSLRDPFSDAWNLADASGSTRPDPNRRKEPLEQYPLDSLDMVGTIGQGSGLLALVMAPDKVTYRVRPGSYMGQSDGRVTGVREDRIELIELVPDGAGGWLERPAALALDDQ